MSNNAYNNIRYMEKKLKQLNEKTPIYSQCAYSEARHLRTSLEVENKSEFKKVDSSELDMRR